MMIMIYCKKIWRYIIIKMNQVRNIFNVSLKYDIQENIILTEMEKIKYRQSQIEDWIRQVGFVPFRSVKMGCMSAHADHILQIDKYKEKLRRLFSGLDMEAAKNLRAILARQERCATKNSISFDELFSGEDAEAYRKLQEFENSVYRKGEYFVYDDKILPVDSFEPESFLYAHGIKNLKTFTSIGNKTIIDVGAYIGDSVLAFRDFTNAPIICFEPNPYNFCMLNKTIELNSKKYMFDNVITEKLALGDSIGEVSMGTSLYSSIQVHAAAKIGICGYKDECYNVNMVTLDSYVEEKNISIGLIKVDIEGFEQEFLKGALKTLNMQKPILCISIYHSDDDFFNIKPFIESLDLGYKFDFFQGVNRWLRNDIMLLCEVR